MLIGDFNARTHTLPDNLPNNKHDEDYFDMRHYLNRNNCDKTQPNLHGKSLINLCRSTNLRILNGRKIGDSFGNFHASHTTGVALSITHMLLNRYLTKSLCSMSVHNQNYQTTAR